MTTWATDSHTSAHTHSPVMLGCPHGLALRESPVFTCTFGFIKFFRKTRIDDSSFFDDTRGLNSPVSVYIALAFHHVKHAEIQSFASAQAVGRSLYPVDIDNDRDKSITRFR